MKQFMKRLMGFSLGPVLGAAISFLLFPIFMDLLPVYEYGRAGAFQNMLIQVPTFIYLGLDQAFTREYNHRVDKRSLMQQAMFLPLVFAVVICIILAVTSSQLAAWLLDDANLGYIVLYAAVWILTTVIERFVLLSIRMQEKALAYSFFNLALKIGNFAVSMILIWLGWRDFRVVVYGLIFGHILANLIMFWRYRQLFVITDYQIDRDLIGKMFQFGLPIMIATSLAALLNLVDTFFLTHFSDFENIGIYKAGSQIGAVISIVKTAFASFWIPTAYRWYEEDKAMKHYQYISDMILFVMSGIFFALLLLKSPIAIVLNPNREYNEFQYIISLLAFPHLMYTLSETTTLGIVFSRKTHYNIIVSLLALVTSVSINFLLTPSIGFRGAALASTGAYIVFYLARTYFSMKTGFYFPQRKQVMTVIVMLLAGIVNLYPNPYSLWITLGLTILTILLQVSTLKTTWDIYQRPETWDFT